MEFVDGVTRLNGMKKADDLKYQIKTRQQQLRELIDRESVLLCPSSPPPSSPINAQSLMAWEETTPITKPGHRPYPYNKHLNGMVYLYSEQVTNLMCDVLVMPLTSCFRDEETDNGEMLITVLMSVNIFCPNQSLCSCCMLEVQSYWMNSHWLGSVGLGRTYPHVGTDSL